MAVRPLIYAGDIIISLYLVRHVRPKMRPGMWEVGTSKESVESYNEARLSWSWLYQIYFGMLTIMIADTAQQWGELTFVMIVKQ